MKIKVKNIFTKKNKKTDILTEDNIVKEDTNVIKRKRRKGARIDDNKLKNYFDNFFKNKNKLSKGYYILLICMLALGGASVVITAKSYNLFAKEEYELYAQSDDNTEAISTISEVNNNENNSSNTKDLTGNVSEAKLNNTNVNTNTSNNSSSNKNKTTVTVKPLSFSKPIEGQIQKPYSIDKVIYSKTLELWKTHDGIDISAKIGTNVKAIEKGVVEKVYEDSFYGTTIVIDHGQGYKSSYSNLDKNTSVKEKQTISKSQVIGKISNTSIGEIKDEAHLHFTLFKDNNNVDPTYIFK